MRSARPARCELCWLPGVAGGEEEGAGAERQSGVVRQPDEAVREELVPALVPSC